MENAAGVEDGTAVDERFMSRGTITLLSATSSAYAEVAFSWTVEAHSGRLLPPAKDIRWAAFEDPRAALEAARQLVTPTEGDPEWKAALSAAGVASFEARSLASQRECRRLLHNAHWSQVLVSDTMLPFLASDEVEPLSYRRLKLLTFAEPKQVYVARGTPGTAIPLLPLALCTKPLRSLHSSYGAAYREAHESGLSDFESIESLEVEDAERIRDRVFDASRVTARFDAWRQLPVSVFDLLLAPVLRLSFLVWLGLMFVGSDTFLGFVLSVVLSIFGLVLMFCVPWVLGIQSDRGFLVWFLSTAAVTALVLHGVLDTERWPAAVMRAFDLTATTLVVALGVICLLIIAERAALTHVEHKKLATATDDEVIDTLVVTLKGVREHLRSGRSGGTRDELTFQIEWLAKAIERRQPSTGDKNDCATRAWVRDTHRKMAADVRRLKRLVLAPRPDDETRLVASLSRMLVDACDGHWGRFGRREPPTGPTRKARALVALRGIGIAAFPLALVGIVTLIPGTVDHQLTSTLTTGSIGWAAVSVLGMLDPRADERADALGKLINPLKSQSRDR